MSAPAGEQRLEREYFDALYAGDPDPWNFTASDYERDKYEHTVAALGEQRFASGLEVGCSIGVLTRLLAAHGDSLLAVDISEAAVSAARERTAGLDGVTVEQRSLPEDTPAGPFDLIVCSEVLYYWSEELLREGLDALVEQLAPGGRLLAVHWTEPTRDYPLEGSEVHDILRAHPDLVPIHGEGRTHYRLDLLARA